jgi:hypothetical protein
MRAARREWLVLAGPSQGRAQMRTADPPAARYPRSDERPADYATDVHCWLIPRPRA